MKKILIISYFYPPSNFAGSYRLAAWARHFHRFGYYPVIVTRCWNENQSNVIDEQKNNKFSHEKYDTHEIYRLPYQPNLRDRLYQKYGNNRFRLLGKFLTFLEIFGQHYTNSVIPYSNLYKFAKGLLNQEMDFKFLILSGRPFQLFKFGYQLHRDTGIRWIADYRDEWNSHQWITGLTPTDKVISALESRSEKKWLSSATLFTTVSEDWVKSISAYIGKPGKAVLNGYDDNIIPATAAVSPDGVFRILHNGTLYAPQKVEIFLDGVKKFVDQNPDAKVNVSFPGIDYIPEQGARLRSFMSSYENYFTASVRIPKAELAQMMAAANLLLMVGSGNMRGHHSSKIFEYLICSKPIVLCPDDHDVMAELIDETKSGVVLDSADEVAAYLAKSYADFTAGKAPEYIPDKEKISFYSREKQTGVLARILDDLK